MRRRGPVAVGGPVLVALVAAATVVGVRSMARADADAGSSAATTPVATATAGAVAGAGTPGPAPAPSDAGTPSGLTSQQWADQGRLDVVADAVHTIGGRDPAFDLVAIDLPTMTVTVYRADPRPDRQSALYRSAATPGVRLAFAHALLSFRQRDQLFRITERQTRLLAGQGVRITQASEQGPGGVFRVGYDPAGRPPTAAMLRAFEIYGPGTVAFAPEPPAIALADAG